MNHKIIFAVLVLAAVFTAGCVTSSQIPPGCGGLQTDEECAASIATTPAPTGSNLVVKSEQVQATPMPTEAMPEATATINYGAASDLTTPWQPVSDTNSPIFQKKIGQYNLKVSITVGPTRSWFMWWVTDPVDTVSEKLSVKIDLRTKGSNQIIDGGQAECSPGAGCNLPSLKSAIGNANPNNFEWRASLELKAADTTS